MIESAEEFVRLRTSENPGEYWRAAHDTAPESVWIEVIQRFPEMRKWVVHNKTVPANILMRLVNDVDPHVRDTLARVNRLTKEMFETLASDSDENILATISRHRKVPLHILEKLVHDPSE